MAVGEAKPLRSERIMAKGWIQAVVLVSLFGFTVLGFMAFSYAWNGDFIVRSDEFGSGHRDDGLPE